MRVYSEATKLKRRADDLVRQTAKYKKNRHAYFHDKVCEDCGSNENLELHHLDPAKKRSHVIWTWSENSRQEELDKCIPLCAFCHGERTKLQISRPIPHGTDGGYGRGCRCVECRIAHSEYSADYYKRRSETNRALVKEKVPLVHGTRAGYMKNCRCESCRQANKDYCKELYYKNKTQELRKAA